MISHDQLVALAAQWLQRKKCSVVITELATTGECPDAIGWHNTHTTLVECKVSAADFSADARKYFRRDPAAGLGQNRYFLTEPGLLAVEKLPAGWGLIEATGDKFRVLRKSDNFPANQRHEAGILLSAIRRIGATAPKGISVKFYVMDSKGRATLGVATQEVVS